MTQWPLETFLGVLTTSQDYFAQLVAANQSHPKKKKKKEIVVAPLVPFDRIY